jgi:hypothetical protein
VPQDLPHPQAAVDIAHPGDVILIDRGTYSGGVVVPGSLHDLTIRGVDRNEVILDGRDEEENAIYVLGDDVTIENMTAHNFRGNGFYWTGVDGYAGRYLTVSNVGLYGIYAIESHNGVFEHSFVSGAADAAFYIGECDPCDATLTDLTARLSAVGYSGTNASGNVVVEDSLWELNGTGILPNSYDVGKAEPPQERSVFRNNVVRGSGSVPVPVDTPLAGFWGLGIAIAGGNENLVEGNQVSDSARYGVVIYPTVQDGTTWVPQANLVRGNTVRGSGTADLALSDGTGPGNCFEDNDHETAAPADLGAEGCPLSGSDDVAAELVVPPPVAEEQAAGVAPFIPDAPHYSEIPPPPPQPTMPGPLQGLPEASYPGEGSAVPAVPAVLAGLGLAAVLGGAIGRRLRSASPTADVTARRLQAMVGALIPVGLVLLLIGGAWLTFGRPERPSTVEGRSPEGSPSTSSGSVAPPRDELEGRLAYPMYAEDAGVLLVKDVRKRGPGEELVRTPGVDIWDVRWSPDGSRVAFSTIGVRPRLVSDVYVLEMSGDQPLLISKDPHLGSCRSPTWSPDGLRLAFECGVLKDPGGYRGEPHLFAAPADGSGPVRQLTTGWGQAPSWSPSLGELIAYQSLRDGNFEIYLVPVQGSGEVRLTDTPQDDTHPSWSPDGQLIAFDSERDSTETSSFGGRKAFDVPSHIYVMAADGSSPRRITPLDPGEELFPRWLSDELIAFFYARAADQEAGTGFEEGIGVVRAQGSEVTRLPGPYRGFDLLGAASAA